MIWEGLLQFLAAGFGTMAFSVLFSVPRALSPMRLHWRCRLVYLLGMINIFHTGAVEANLQAATVFITLASRIGSTVKKCPVTLFLIAGIFPEVPGIGIYRTIYYSMLDNRELSLHYGRETLGIAIAMVLGIILVFEIPQKTINRIFGKNRKACGSS